MTEAIFLHWEPFGRQLSFGVIWLLLWSLLAAAARPAAEPQPRLARPALIGAGVAAAGVALLSAVLCLGARLTDRAAALTDQKQPEAAAALAARAARYDRWDSEPLRLLGDRASLERAAQLDPYHSGIRFSLAIARELAQDYAGALTEAQAALANQPMVSAYYSKVASLQGNLLNEALHNGRRDEARQRAEALVVLGSDFARRKALADPQQSKWNAGPKLQMSADFKLRYGQALYLTGDAAAARPLLTEAAKVGLLGSEAELWLYVIYEKAGDKQAMAGLETKPWIRFRNQNPIYKLLREW